MLWKILTQLTHYLKLLKSMFTQNCTRFSFSGSVFVFLSGQIVKFFEMKRISVGKLFHQHNFDKTVNLQSTKTFNFKEHNLKFFIHHYKYI